MTAHLPALVVIRQESHPGEALQDVWLAGIGMLRALKYTSMIHTHYHLGPYSKCTYGEKLRKRKIPISSPSVFFLLMLWVLLNLTISQSNS